MTNPPNDHQLRLVVAIAKAKSLRVAAIRLGVTQPALSKQIRALELSLSAPLFRRDGRGMELTALGQQLFQAMSHSYDRSIPASKLWPPRRDSAAGVWRWSPSTRWRLTSSPRP